LAEFSGVDAKKAGSVKSGRGTSIRATSRKFAPSIDSPVGKAE
jgi:hypothetical protein